ncbi:phospholipase A2 inhibitor and Ly6/PLAUR domain-containing protein-like [Sceloporus undulatus]|uniref:phospholipase A2 inhibitor and Ly6/PLAUR domain-containing protein-like n=1 Tax=Sceloporus undulatus TaxID=8520 RepID=UPI001C4B3323|nr:phospholipase A2 inhibitor and Ly6/PLAUR domain-containing protein-like [Sceloporus undulatus]XP_042295280.1 phospholipase A2 inhibitor and Ly6/PLAUR domain-containing protein-like [Sceloporus undulatus]XP_042295281.1 phospholipase A2 inhibitor and Ly6/PLAUR domain-containing protein-like [Sceloporus undulatus]XP_042295282.1 phospholipase A2 inhibitor and Ly6/PLAUR domain-containing protein-like [Sceloporus undulatus]
MKALLGLFLFSLLLTSGAFLECETCFATSSNCTGAWERCEDDEDTCAFGITEKAQGGKSELTVEKGCHSSENCTSGWILVTFGKGEFIRKSTNCCTEEDCSSAFSHWPLLNTTANGKRCPACFSVSKACLPAVVNCTGSEDYCLDLVTYTSYTEMRIHLKGCTTESTCAGLQSGMWNIVDTGDNKVDCRPASRGSSLSGSLLSPIFGFLLMTVFS